MTFKWHSAKITYAYHFKTKYLPQYRPSKPLNYVDQMNIRRLFLMYKEETIYSVLK